MSQQPAKTSVKTVIVNHFKLGKIPLGRIAKNEMCRMVVELLQVNDQLQKKVIIASEVLRRIPEDIRKTAADEFAKVINDANKLEVKDEKG